MSQIQDVLMQDICKEQLLEGKRIEEEDSTWNGTSDQLNNVTVVDENTSVLELIKKKIGSFGQDDKNAFYVGDLSEVVNQYYRFQRELPRVKPFYAVKCNNSKEVLHTLSILGTGFDCASKAEIDMILGLGVPADDIVYANTCKQSCFIRHAAKHGVFKMTFDCESELFKVAEDHPAAEMILRIVVDDTKSFSCLSKKFGAPLQKCEDLLKLAKALNLSVIGVSFHVGSKSRRPEAFSKSIADARRVFDLGRKFGHVMRLLDIGGGFSGDYDFQPGFEEFATVINEALDKYFPSKSGVEIIAEPGRFFVATAFTAALNIIGKKQNYEMGKEGKQERKLSYYLNDGIFGTFWGFGPSVNDLKPKPLKDHCHSETRFSSTLWGPCCADHDLIMDGVSLPELEVGEWIIFPTMGAYSTSITTTFNGFNPPTMFYIMRKVKLKRIPKM